MSNPNSDIDALYSGLQLDWPAIEADNANPFGLRANPTEFSKGQRIILNQFIAKGQKMEQMLLATDEEAGAMMDPPQESAESGMTDPNLLPRWGYVQEQSNEVTCDVQSTLETLDLGDSKDYVGIAHFHTAQFEKDGRMDEPLVASFGMLSEPAKFYQAMNAKTGVIVACSNTSPTSILRNADQHVNDDLVDEEEGEVKEEGDQQCKDERPEHTKGCKQQCGEEPPTDRKHNPLPPTLPDLRFWSDVAYLRWLSVTDTPKNLTCILRHMVINGSVNFVIDAITRKNKTAVTSWPGLVYEAGTDEYHVILGTPNGSSTAFLLAQHKEALGHKTIERIYVFQEEKDLDYSIALCVRDAENENHENEQKADM